MPNLPCTCPAETYVWTRSGSASRNGSSSLVDDDAFEAAKKIGARISAEIAYSMNEWLKTVHCASGCVIGLIHVGPPSPVYALSIRTGHAPRFEILGYDWTVTVTGSLSVDCHKGDQGGHKPATGLPELEKRIEESGLKPNAETAFGPTSHAGMHPPPGTIITR